MDVRNIARLLEEFEQNPTSVAKAMRDWIEHDPVSFCEQAVPILRNTKDGPGYRHILWLISASKILGRILCDPTLLTEEEACALVEKLHKIDPSVEMNLVKEIFGVDGVGGISLSEPSYGLRFLSIFSTKVSVHLLPVVSRLLRHPNATIRSKAATLLGKMSRDYDWLEHTRNDTDDRVRANALEALWEPGIPERLRVRLWEGVQDSSNRVVGNALMGLYRQGESGCIPLIISMTQHREEKFRATAAWVIGETGDDRFREYLFPLLEESTPLVRRNVLHAMQKLDVKAAFAGIERLQLVVFANQPGAPSPSMAAATPMFTEEPGAIARQPHSFSAPEADKQFTFTPGQILRVATVSQHGSPVGNLLATDFRITRDSGLVHRYAVHTEVPPETLSIAFALPSSDAVGTRLNPKWRAFLSHFFKQKRHLDHWAFLEYTDLRSTVVQTSQKPGPAAEHTGRDARRAPLSHGQAAPPENADFIRNFVELDDALTARMPSTRGFQMSSTLDLLLTVPPFVRDGVPAPKGALHAVIIDSSSSRSLPRERLEAVKRTALERGFAIHLISANSATLLAELPAATGGTFLLCQDDIESWQRQLTILYASLFSTYRVELEAPETDREQTKIRIVVRKGPLFGELRTTCAVSDSALVPA